MNQMEEMKGRGLHTPELVDVEMVFEISRVELHHNMPLLELVTSYLSGCGLLVDRG